jgi:hypothetical protein
LVSEGLERQLLLLRGLGDGGRAGGGVDALLRLEELVFPCEGAGEFFVRFELRELSAGFSLSVVSRGERK